MKRLFILVPASAALLSLVACENPDAARREREHNRYGYHGQNAPDTEYHQPAPKQPSEPSEPSTPPEPTPPPPPTDTTQSGGNNPAPVAKKDYQYGKAVPGKAGFVTSPFAPYAGYVDVRGFPPGTEVKDPYTGKIFLVP